MKKLSMIIAAMTAVATVPAKAMNAFEAMEALNKISKESGGKIVPKLKRRPDGKFDLELFTRDQLVAGALKPEPSRKSGAGGSMADSLDAWFDKASLTQGRKSAARKAAAAVPAPAPVIADMHVSKKATIASKGPTIKYGKKHDGTPYASLSTEKDAIVVGDDWKGAIVLALSSKAKAKKTALLHNATIQYYTLFNWGGIPQFHINSKATSTLYAFFYVGMGDEKAAEESFKVAELVGDPNRLGLELEKYVRGPYVEYYANLFYFTSPKAPLSSAIEIVGKIKGDQLKQGNQIKRSLLGKHKVFDKPVYGIHLNAEIRTVDPKAFQAFVYDQILSKFKFAKHIKDHLDERFSGSPE